MVLKCKLIAFTVQAHISYRSWSDVCTIIGWVCVSVCHKWLILTDFKCANTNTTFCSSEHSTLLGQNNVCVSLVKISMQNNEII